MLIFFLLGATSFLDLAHVPRGPIQDGVSADMARPVHRKLVLLEEWR
jgi:hypothetical protein